MIRNNLSILMSERGIKNSTLSMKTGISKNTISSTAQNDGKMIQLETINKICQVLGTTPSEFFSYIPYDISFQLSVDKIDIEQFANDLYELNKVEISGLELVLLFRVEKQNMVIKDYFFENIETSTVNIFTDYLLVNLQTKDNSFVEFWDEIPTPFASDLKLEISKLIKQELKEYIISEVVKYNSLYENDVIKTVEDSNIEIFSLQLGIPF